MKPEKVQTTGICEIKVRWDPNEVDQLLTQKNWSIQWHGTCRRFQGGSQEIPCWIMVRRKAV